jgi:triphosphoribosyl-dephospho-CoA synthase
MSRHPDSLIARKCGSTVAKESASRAAQVLDTGQPGDESYLDALSDLDFWLRSDHHRKNPGTTADLIAAGLFVALRDGLLATPYTW